uniref:START domain-containing protein n=1 Tax=Phytophthora ramorum TaxID=164328 RepID=H3GZN6_PHYRM
MAKDRFTVNPFPGVRVSDLDRQELINLVDIYVGDYVKKYEDFVVVEKRQVDKRRWEHVKSKAKMNVYAERTRKELGRRGIEPGNSLSATQRVQATSTSKDLPVVMSLGTFVGELDDLMLGVVSPTLDDMRVKDTYLHDVDDAAVLCQVVVPSREDPFRSVVVKWMTINMPLQSTNLVKSRDFVFIEATGITYLANGDRVGYQLLHSIEFPQTKPLLNKTRGNLSIFSCFRRKRLDVIESFA